MKYIERTVSRKIKRIKESPKFVFYIIANFIQDHWQTTQLVLLHYRHPIPLQCKSEVVDKKND